MKQVVGTLFFKDKKLLIDKPRKRATYQMIGGSVEENESIFDAAIRECKEELGDRAIFDPLKIKFLMEFDEIATSDPNLTISDEIENFMWFGRNDDRNILSNTLKNEIIPYAIENSLI